MIDFYASFMIIIALVVLIIPGSIIFVIIRVIIKTFAKKKREENEQKVIDIAVLIERYCENRKIENIDELKNIKIPKKMKIEKTDNDIIIKYKDFIYSVDTGRFIVNDI